MISNRDLAFGTLLGATVLVALAIAAYWATHTVQKDARLAGLPLPVETVRVRLLKLNETIGVAGRLEPSTSVNLTAKVASRVLKVPVDLGELVQPGQVLVQMDSRPFETNLEAARDAYEHARRQLARIEALKSRRFATAVDLEKARTDEAAMREIMVRDEIELANTRVVSPVVGVVLRRKINPGEVPEVDQGLMEIGVVDPIVLVAEVPEDKLGWIHLGMAADASTDASPDDVLRGSIIKTDFSVNESTRSFAVYIRLANHGMRLMKGVTGRAVLQNRRMALAVPSTAIMNPVGTRAVVFVVSKDRRVHIREIRRGLAVGSMTEVLEGLREGEEVVTVGQLNLQDNDLVSPNNFAPWDNRPGRSRLRSSDSEGPSRQ